MTSIKEAFIKALVAKNDKAAKNLMLKAAKADAAIKKARELGAKARRARVLARKAATVAAKEVNAAISKLWTEKLATMKRKVGESRLAAYARKFKTVCSMSATVESLKVRAMAAKVAISDTFREEVTAVGRKALAAAKIARGFLAKEYSAEAVASMVKGYLGLNA